MSGYKSHHPLFRSWSGMMQRCYNLKDKRYHRYGARGIMVCDRWHDFNLFVLDVGERPTGTTMDRIDNDKGYCPENFRWATSAEQSINKVTVRKIIYAGEVFCMQELTKILGICPNTMYKWIKQGRLELASNDPHYHTYKEAYGNLQNV